MKTFQEYADFQAAVVRGLEGLNHVSTGACPGCKDCGLPDEPDDHEYDLANESSFSWSACECCGSRIGGDRHPAHGRNEADEIVHFRVCVDCLYFLNYGRLDDLTMLEMHA